MNRLSNGFFYRVKSARQIIEPRSSIRGSSTTMKHALPQALMSPSGRSATQQQTTVAIATVVSLLRKRRASDSHLRALLEDDSAVIVPALARHGGEISKGRYGVARSHKLTPNDIACIRMMDGSLRAIAAEFGVSHELVRSIRNA